MGKRISSSVSLNVKILLPINHFLLLSLIQSQKAGFELTSIQLALQNLSPVLLQKLGLARSKNALYHVLSRLIKQGFVESQSQGFQKPVKYQISLYGQDSLEAVKECLNAWKLSVPVLPYREEETNSSQILDDQIYMTPGSATSDLISRITKRWIEVIHQQFFPTQKEIPVQIENQIQTMSRKMIPVLKRLHDSVERQEELQTMLLNNFLGNKSIHLNAENLLLLVRMLDQIFLDEYTHNED